MQIRHLVVLYGGIVGEIYGDTSIVKQCYNGINGGIYGEYYGCGGIAGSGGGSIEDAYNLGTVEGGSDVGGIVGGHWFAGNYVRNVYNVGTISALGHYCGGIVGGIWTSSCNNFINIGTVNNLSEANYINDVVGKWNSDVVWEGGTWLGSTDVSISDMKNWSEEEIKSYLGNNFEKDTNGINNGLPVFGWQND